MRRVAVVHAALTGAMAGHARRHPRRARASRRVWRRRVAAAVGTRRAPPPRRRRRPTRVMRASPRSSGAISPRTSTRARRAACAGRATKRCRASATRTPSGCSSARRPARRRTRAASRSSARPGRLLDNMLAALGLRARRERLHRERAQVPAARTTARRSRRGRRRAGRISSARSRCCGRSSSSRSARAPRRCCSTSTRRSPACAGACTDYRGRPAHRHLSSGLPAAQSAGQGEGVGGPAARADARIGRAAIGARRGRRRARLRRPGRVALACAGADPILRAAGRASSRLHRRTSC